jgi:hypothetical protein
MGNESRLGRDQFDHELSLLYKDTFHRRSPFMHDGPAFIRRTHDRA